MTCEGHPAFCLIHFCATFSGHTKASSLQKTLFRVQPKCPTSAPGTSTALPSGAKTHFRPSTSCMS
ncbi:hypothetical protein CXK92_08150 [Stutzerimonas stutzeri]|uniref:Uncharacterized protein n=1 Tax=Stutzerimonas stutzeri TaxID=316 RepID=A0A2N8S582_STUST|nr:hypothetical protein CXK92_08150 [Stutzerimonas stutzeri]